MPEQFLMDPTSEATGTQLDVSTDPYAVSAFSSPAPPLETATSGSIDTEGDTINARRHQNRQVSLTVEVTGTSQTNLDANVATLEAKVAKLALEGGTFRRVRTDATFRTLDILAADQYEKAFDVTYFVGNMAVCQINLLAEPYARGAEASLGTFSETAGPVLNFSVTTVDGDVPALGRVVVVEGQAVNQYWMIWGTQGLNDSASTLLVYDGANLSALNGSTSGTATGASGGTAIISPNGVFNNAMVGLGSAGTIPNIGAYRVYARITTPTAAANPMAAAVAQYQGGTQLSVTWTQPGSGATTTNTSVTPSQSANGLWQIVDLGQIRLEKAAIGTQSSTVQVVANTAGAPANRQVIVDMVFLVPIQAASGVAYGDTVSSTPTLDASGEVQIRYDGVRRKVGATSSYRTPYRYEGDYLRIRPGRAQFVVKAARLTPGLSVQDFMDDISATLFVTPRYLNVT